VQLSVFLQREWKAQIKIKDTVGSAGAPAWWQLTAHGTTSHKQSTSAVYCSDAPFVE
jgi:hypothetical protein